jgi:hypothetical protein
VYQGDSDEWLVRVGRYQRLAQSPSGPLFEPGSPAPDPSELTWIPTGQSLLLVSQTGGLRAAQILETGKLEALAPR